jgi:hypothetical protein
VEFLPDNGHAVPSESGETMSRGPRRNHTPGLKAEVALARRSYSIWNCVRSGRYASSDLREGISPAFM